MNDNVLIKTYKGSQSDAVLAFERDREKLKAQGYTPTSQDYEQGQWGGGAFLIAVVLCFIIVGILALIFMMVVKPDGTLTVRYKKINMAYVDDFVRIYIENEEVCKKDRELANLFQKLACNDYDMTDETISRATIKMDTLLGKIADPTAEPSQENAQQQPKSDVKSRIQNLQSLLNEGLIDEDEFAAKKKDILAAV